MSTLAINTASSKTAIALLEKGKVLKESAWLSQNDEAEKLMPAIYSLLKSGKKEFTDIDRVMVVRGPGSFTGLRVGVTAANTIAYLTQAKLFAIDAFQYFHAVSERPVVIFAGSGGVYLCETSGAIPQIINLKDLPAALKNIPEIQGDISIEQKMTLKDTKFLENHLTFGQVMAGIDTGNMKAESIIKPLYIKPPGITKSKKHALHSFNTDR